MESERSEGEDRLCINNTEDDQSASAEPFQDERGGEEEGVGEQHLHQASDNLYNPWSIFYFFCGSILYVITTIWDLRSLLAEEHAEQMESGDDDGNDNDDWSESLIEIPILDWDLYDLLSAGGPSLYLLNALNDIRVECQSPQVHWWYMAISVLFAAAAVFDLAASLIYDTATEVASYISSSLAVHLYMLFSIFALWRKPYDHYANISLVVTGDALFFLGSLIDVVTSYFACPCETTNWELVESWYLVSAVLWFVCAVVYIATNLVEGRAARTRERTLVATTDEDDEDQQGQEDIGGTADGENDEDDVERPSETDCEEPLL